MAGIVTKTSLLLGASLIVGMVCAESAAQAQDANSDAGDGEFLGTITLGESKRDVQTDTATAVTVIDQDEIDDRQASTIAELIDSVPGVTLVNGSSPAGSGINIRGFGANSTYGTDQKVAIIVDGASTGAEELYRIGNQLFTDPYLYKSVEVTRGTVGSYEYGSGIVGGTVRLETKDASDFTGGVPGFNVGVTIGAYSNTDGLNGSVTGAWQPTENLELLANYAYREQDVQDDGDGEEIGNSAFELPSYLLKGRYSFGESHSVMASYTNSEAQDRDVPYDSFGTTGGSFGNVDRDTTTETTSVVYTFNPVANELINLDVALTYANQEITQDCIEESAPFGCFAVVDADHQYETTKLTAKNYSFLETGAFTHDMRYGVEWLEKERLDANSAPGGTDERYALFLVDEITLADGLTFTPAVRYESQELEGAFFSLATGERIPGTTEYDALVGAASLRYEFDSGFAAFASYAYSESFPILDDIPASATSNTVNVVTPELINTFEAGLSYDTIGFLREEDVFAFKLNVYNTVVDDITSYAGADQVELNGVEIEGSYALPSGTYFDLNANFVDGEEIQEPDDEGMMAVVDWDNTPQDTIRLTVGQRIGEATDVSAEVLTAFDRTVDTGSPTPTEVDAFTVLNLRATIAPQEGVLEGTQFRFGVENALDEFYTPLLATRPAPGRNFKVTVSHLF